MPLTTDTVEDVFTYHAPTPEQLIILAEIREQAKSFASYILNTVPNCADRTSSLRNLRMCVMEANAATVLNGLV
jgi:hypothetical protein